jgi:hypothetical protein
VLLIITISEDHVTALAHDDGGARVLARGQNHARRDVRILQELKGDKAVVISSLGVLKDVGQLLEVAGTEKVTNLEHGLLGKKTESLGLNLKELLTVNSNSADVVRRELLVRSVYRVDTLEYRGVVERRSGELASIVVVDYRARSL